MPVTEQVILAAPGTGRNPSFLAAPWLFTGEDNLRLVIMNSQAGVAVTLGGRRLGPKDTNPQAFVYTVIPTADRMPSTFDFSFGEGFLLNCSLIVTAGAPLVGQTYCMLQIIRGLSGSRLVLGCLLGGYVTAMQHLAYPGSPIESSIAGGGYVRVIGGTQPAHGAEILETVPASARWQIHSFAADFTTSAVVNNRVPDLLCDNGVSNISRNPLGALLTAGNIWRVFWTPGSTPQYSGTTSAVVNTIPIGLKLLAGDRLRTLTANLDVNDQWAQPIYTVEEWLEAA